MHSIRAKKVILNKPLKLSVIIEEFYKNNVINHINKGGIGGYVQEGNVKHRIVLYGMVQRDYLKLNIGDTIDVKGNLGETPFERYGVSELNSYDLITLNNCILVKKW